MKEMIKLENVSFDYSDLDSKTPAHDVLKNISLTVEKGSFVAIIGHNGSGKSTLAKLCNAVLLPKSGRVLVDGIDTQDEERLFEIRQKVGMVFQNPDNQIVATTVEEDVAFGPENLGIEPKEIRKRVAEALESVNMTSYKKHSPSQLSGGQKQRVAIAGIMAMKPECIIFDESTAMLDPQGRKEVLDAIKTLRDESMTVVLITHYMSEAVGADRIIVMNDGEIEMDGTPSEVFSNVERLKEIGLDVPQVTELLYRLRLDGHPLPANVISAGEGAEKIAELILNKKR